MTPSRRSDSHGPIPADVLAKARAKDLPVGKAGWVPVERWKNRYSHQFCETERHRGKFKRSVAVAVVQVHIAAAGYPVGDMVFGMCASCLKAAQDNDFPKEPLPV